MKPFYQNVAIIYSKETLRLNIKEAEELNEIYAFEGSRGHVHWLKGEHAYLAVNGLSNILRRLGIKFDVIYDFDATENILANYDFIFIPDAQHLPDLAFKGITERIKKGEKFIISGKSNIDPSLYGAETFGYKRLPNFTGIKWIDESTCIKDKNPLVFSCPGYTVHLIKSNSRSESLGKLAVFTCEDGSSKDIVKLSDYDAVVATDNTIYFALPVFEYIGALLQGHMSFEKTRDVIGESANFYIDTLAICLRQILSNRGFNDMFKVKHRIWGSYDNVLILRHDTDSSRDTTYPDYESKNNIPSTYPVLLDKNYKFWINRLRKDSSFELSFHFTSAKSGFLRRLISPKAPMPVKKLIVKDGIIKQLKKASRICNFDFHTIHRHGHFFYYPETLEALDYMFEQFRNILCSQVMFRSVMYSYADSRNPEKITVSHPDTSVPFWFPFKLIMASVEEHRELRGWDCTEFIEPDKKIIDLCIEKAKLLSGGVYTMGFHPAHTQNKTFGEEGSYGCFLYCVERARENKWWIATYKMVLDKLNDWQDLRIRSADGEVTLFNNSSRTIKDIVIESSGLMHHVDALAAHQKETLVL
jgi:hypothetical protein